MLMLKYNHRNQKKMFGLLLNFQTSRKAKNPNTPKGSAIGAYAKSMRSSSMDSYPNTLSINLLSQGAGSELQRCSFWPFLELTR